MGTGEQTLRIICFGFLCVLPILAGCGTVRETLPDRSALEQMLISTAADRAVIKLPPEAVAEKAVYLETSNLDCYDKPYVVQRIRHAVLQCDGRLVEKPELAEVTLEVASGGLSINKRSYLFGLPELPLPIPFAGETLKTPELAIFKIVFYRGRAKLLFNAVDPATQGQLLDIRTCYGDAKANYWWLLLFGPFEQTDLPEAAR